MPPFLRSIVDAILGRVPGRPGRVDTSTRMAADADFDDRDDYGGQGRKRPSEDVEPIDELLRIVGEAQSQDAEDERRLGDPAWRNRRVSYARQAAKPRSR